MEEALNKEPNKTLLTLLRCYYQCVNDDAGNLSTQPNEMTKWNRILCDTFRASYGLLQTKIMFSIDGITNTHTQCISCSS